MYTISYEYERNTQDRSYKREVAGINGMPKLKFRIDANSCLEIHIAKTKLETRGIMVVPILEEKEEIEKGKS
jgi:hypothetical protein